NAQNITAGPVLGPLPPPPPPAGGDADYLSLITAPPAFSRSAPGGGVLGSGPPRFLGLLDFPRGGRSPSPPVLFSLPGDSRRRPSWHRRASLLELASDGGEPPLEIPLFLLENYRSALSATPAQPLASGGWPSS